MLKVANSVINASMITGTLPVANGGTGVTTSTGTGNTVLSAAPTLSGDVTLSTGNLIPSTAAKGINFTANTPSATGTMTSQLLNWYEEGTWTATLGGTATYGFSVGKYTRIGRAVYITNYIYVSSLGTGSTTTISGLPFVASATPNLSSISIGYFATLAVTTTMLVGNIPASTSTIVFGTMLVSGGTITNNSPVFQTNTDIAFSATYFI